MNKIVKINAGLITNWNSFHQIFKITFGFPNFYGNNMNAWIVCMSDIDDKDAGMTTFWLNTNTGICKPFKVKANPDLWIIGCEFRCINFLFSLLAFVEHKFVPDKKRYSILPLVLRRD